MTKFCATLTDSALSVLEFVVINKVTLISQPHCFSDFSRDFFLFLKVELVSKGRKFNYIAVIQAKSQDGLPSFKQCML